MGRHENLDRVLNSGIVAVIRSQSSEQLVEVARALYEGGVDVLEVTLTVPNVLDIIAAVHRALGDRVLLGAGTALDPESARAAILAGAEYVVAPSTNLDVIKICHRYDKLVIPGAFTPTEIVTAWEAGADIIKLFPADIGGPSYLKTLRGPLPQVRILPTGGIGLDNAGDFIRAGACAVGLGGNLVDPKAIQAGDMRRIQDLAAQYVEVVKKARA